MSYKNPLAEREHAIEEAYFQKENRRLIERMRARREAAESGAEPEELDVATILVATDFSTSAAHATDMAIDYARKLGSKVVLVHAYDLPIPMPGPTLTGSYALPEGLIEEVAKAARDTVAAAAEEVSATGVECEGVAIGLPAAVGIVNEAIEREADLVIMGTRGLTGLKHFALGSVAEKVVRTAPCPVLTVPAP